MFKISNPLSLPTRIRCGLLGEAPLHGELFSAEQLFQHAKELAAQQKETGSGCGNPLLIRLNQNRTTLREFNQSRLADKKSKQMTPAAEWLIDNFYVIEEHIQLVRKHLPRRYGRGLPCLSSGRLKGLPRIYSIVLEFISHVDAQTDKAALKDFIDAYQTVTPLKLGELWAVPIMLRLALIENLQRIATGVDKNQRQRDLAILWVDRMQAVAKESPSGLIGVVADMAQSDIKLTSSFVAEFCQHLSSQNSQLHMARNWLEQRLGEEGLSIESMLHAESQRQAANQLSVSHSIKSLRLLGDANWQEFVEELSLVERTLRQDPAGVYPSMDFFTRDRYRHEVERLARKSELSEEAIAAAAIRLADPHSADSKAAHVGFYLVDEGCPQLAKAVGARFSLVAFREVVLRRFALGLYAGAITAFTLLSTLALVLLLRSYGLQLLLWETALLVVPALLAFSQLAVAFVNRISMFATQPYQLARLDFSEGIASDCRTAVVVPAMLSDAGAVDALLERMELHYLCNSDEALHFVLLTDFCDAPQEHMPTDAALLEYAQTRVQGLNREYPSAAGERFVLLHRPRRWNPAQNVWMGYERKRGKLMDFNALLRGAAGTGAFSFIEGSIERLHEVKYVITLDADTQLPREAAHKLVGAMAHPLNRPEFDPQRNVVVKGYGILQPRMTSTLPSSQRSHFARLFSGEAGLDPYTRAVSDVYQDVFHEGSFVGKGIYDVDAFERALAGRFPENRILSHDLLESAYVRSGLMSDLELYDDFPCGYHVDAGRRHRWMRGDWQIARWLLPTVPIAGGRREANPLSGLAKWKLFDNLRRSLAEPALLLLFVGFSLFAPQVWWLGALLAVLVVALPIALGVSASAVCKSREQTWSMHFWEIGQRANEQFQQTVLSLVLLPHNALLALDAVGRTLFRLTFSRKNLLQWKAAADAEKTAPDSLAGYYLSMSGAVVFVWVYGLLLAFLQPEILLYVLPLLGVWLASPWLAWLVSRPFARATVAFGAEQKQLLRRIARKTWHFFDTFVTEEENWLPPDNFQEVPTPTIASRTSPTNIGLSLLANLCAYDFGYLTAGGLLRRTHLCFTTLERLKTFRGHLYNWYDTRTLEPLPPLYVSSVDSGNLAGHLMALGQGLVQLQEAPVYSPRLFGGLLDTVRIMRPMTRDTVELTRLEALLLKEPPAPIGLGCARLLAVIDCVEAWVAQLDPAEEMLAHWSGILQRDCAAHRDELFLLAPWLQEDVGDISLLADYFPQGGGEGDHAVAQMLARLNHSPSLADIAQLEQTLCPQIEALLADAAELQLPVEAVASLTTWLALLQQGCDQAQSRIDAITALKDRCEALAQMDFAFLYDTSKRLFTIGYNVAEQRADTAAYDLLASEARLCSYVAIAQGQVPQEHWFSLSRLLVISQSEPVLLSWSGSMFEYLMPLLVMPDFENTLLSHTCKTAVDEQIAYGRRFGIPWGISESGYNRTDSQLTYQYRAFGIPSLGLKRGLSESLVVAPYATALALMVSPRKACANLQRLTAEGREGAYGYYEAIDYTAAHLHPEESSATVFSFMAHHQGMSLLSLGNLLLDNPMPRRFMANPMLKAAELLLQERVSRNIISNRITDDSKFELAGQHPLAADRSEHTRVFKGETAFPEVHLLSNGRYHVMINNAGGGYSRWRDMAVTRWREDAACGSRGVFVYLRDLSSNDIFSATQQPLRHDAKDSECLFTQAYAEFRQRHSGLEVRTVVCVSPEDDVELRRITITNHSNRPRPIELTSYGEVVITAQAADEAHPAFSNLFVQTQFVKAADGVFCSRRARSENEMPPHLLHQMILPPDAEGEISCETDRSRFIGRGHTLANPLAMSQSGALSGTDGPVLDPVVSLRREVSVAPGKSVTVYVTLGMADSRSAAEGLADKYRSPRICERAFELAWTHSQLTLQQLNASGSEAQQYGKLAGSLIYASPGFRASASVLKSNRRRQSDLWSYGISGDVPLVLLRVSSSDGLDLVRQLVHAHAYWRIKGLAVELMIVNEDTSAYRQPLHEEIVSVIASGVEAPMLEKPNGIFVRRIDQIPREDLILLQAVARVVLDDADGTFNQQLSRNPVPPVVVPKLPRSRMALPAAPVDLPERELLFHNGLGGFTPDGREYVITLGATDSTPAPWCNVLANERFGSVISESGGAYTWMDNAHMFRLSPWHNDPVQDTSGEAFYIRDEQTGQFWSPTPQPARGTAPYVIRHGFGYTVFEHTDNGIASELWVYVDTQAAIKFSVLKLRNLSGRARQLSATGYCEWVLADNRHKSLLHVQTQLDLKTGALVARNRYNGEFAEKLAFLHVGEECTVSADRNEFIGSGGSLAQPAAMKRTRLSGRTGAGLDPCAAVQVAFELAAGEERQVRFRLGAADSIGELHALVARFQPASSCHQALERVWEYWNRALGAINVDTPEASVNMLANGWLLYQTLSARIFGRSGFYQSGGAFGYRDQLQDVMALSHAEPAVARRQILLAASRQFVEGDVQHWWHPPSGAGVRTHFSDDYLWLPFVTCQYVASVADTGILDEVVPFLEGRPLRPDEESYYDLPVRSDQADTLYEHCVRSIRYGLKFGAHGLPLIGCGDWNDGMNLVGKEGRGESVWLAFFLYDILMRFSKIAQMRDDADFAQECHAQALKLQGNIEQHAWDGHWYRRAFFDDGTPLGSKTNQECQIDSLPQSWSVLSEAAPPERSLQAMSEVNRRLVNREDRLIKLFTPAFDTSPLNPGYIKGYIPGVRENGGQYTHGAIWVIMAFARMGEIERAWELFSLLNPILHGSTAEQIAVYKVEPYVIAADVYGVPPHSGRGGWTWYTGSAGWMYRLMVETLLGITRCGSRLHLSPRLPQSWPGYKVHYRYQRSVYHIEFIRITGDALPRLVLDGEALAEKTHLPLEDDNREHFVQVWVD